MGCQRKATKASPATRLPATQAMNMPPMRAIHRIHGGTLQVAIQIFGITRNANPPMQFA